MQMFNWVAQDSSVYDALVWITDGFFYLYNFVKCYIRVKLTLRIFSLSSLLLFRSWKKALIHFQLYILKFCIYLKKYESLLYLTGKLYLQTLIEILTLISHYITPLIICFISIFILSFYAYIITHIVIANNVIMIVSSDTINVSNVYEQRIIVIMHVQRKNKETEKSSPWF